MRIVVDEMPKSREECLFFDWKSNIYDCGLTNGGHCLGIFDEEKGSDCPYLIEARDVERITFECMGMKASSLPELKKYFRNLNGGRY